MPNATVFFATNRTPDDKDNPTEFPGPPNTPPVSPNDPIYFGQAQFNGVQLTPEPDDDSTHVLNSLGSQAQIVIAQERIDQATGAVTPLAGRQGLGPMLHAAKGNAADALICIHGYSYTFQQSLARAAQLQDWYNDGAYAVPFIVFLLAWPSNGLPVGFDSYHDDRARAEASGPALGRAVLAAYNFLSAIVPPERIHLLAHSMGNWALRGAIQSISGLGGGVALPQFNQVLLAAADEDDNTLSDATKLQPLLGACRRLTVYCNMYDLALLSSANFMGNPSRLGRDGPANWNAVNAIPNVAVASAASVVDPVEDGEQHQYYRLSEYVRRDLQQVVAGTADRDVFGRGVTIYNGQYVLTQAIG
jgi:esterase/lipase superfamily enzyme